MATSEHSHEQPHTHSRQSLGMRGPLKAALLLGLGLYFAGIIANGSLKNYINPQLTWLATIASSLFILLGLVSAYELLRERSRRQDREQEHDHEQIHSHGISWPALAIVAIPLALGTLVPSRPLGAAGLEGNVSSANMLREKAIVPDTDPSEWNILEWQRTFNSRLKPNNWFDGLQAEVVGFIVRPQGVPQGHFVVARWVMRHCAADAYGVGLLTSGGDAENLSLDTWVRAKGTMDVLEINGEDVLVLRAESIDGTIGEPDPAYLFPFWNPQQ